MASSGTYSYSLSNGSLILGAFERIQIFAPSLRQEHMLTARREINLAFAEWSNRQPNLWEVSPTAVTLVDGTATYDIASKVVMILDAYISINYGDDDQTDYIIMPFDRSDYASVAQKQTPGRPSNYWFNRQISPTLTLWPVPNDSIYTLTYYACTQMQDANLAGGETPDVPYRWLDALTASLSHRLSRVYAPQLEAQRGKDAQDAWEIAATQDVEAVNFAVVPALSGYYR